jgi:hypothetical protein
MDNSVSLTATVVILAILTAVIFAFAIVAFLSIFKTEKSLIAMGQRDQEIKADKEASKKKGYKIANILTTVLSYFVIAVSVGVMIFSVYAKSKDEMLWNSNGNTSLVIASSSMTKTYDAATQPYITTERKSLQFSRGDVLKIHTIPTLEEMMPKKDSSGNYIRITEENTNDSDIQSGGYSLGSYVNDYLFNTVFVYYNPYVNVNIVHRLVYINFDPTHPEVEPTFRFRGDNVELNDTQSVTYSQLRGMYAESNKVKGVGYVVLFFQDGFGIYSVLASVCMMVVSSIFISKIEKVRNERYHLLEAVADAAKPDEVPGLNDPDEIPAPKKSLKDTDFKTAEKAPTEPVEAVKPVETSPVSPTEPEPSIAPSVSPTDPEPTKAIVDEKPKEENIPSGTAVPAEEEKQDSPSSAMYVKIAKSEGGKN